MFWSRKTNVPDPVDEEKLLIKELKKHRITLPDRQLVINYDDTWKSQPLETLYDLLICYAEAIHIITKQKDPNKLTGYYGLPLNPERKPVWRREYFKLLQRGAKTFGLKSFKESDGSWVVARCFDCETCSRRTDCLVDEE